MWALRVVEVLVFVEGVQEVPLVEDQGAVEELAAACSYPAFHDRVHSGYPDAAAHHTDPSVGEDGVEQGRVLAVPVADDVPRRRSGVVQVHGQVADGLGDPGGGRMRGGAEDVDAARGVFDDRQDVHANSGQRHRLEEVRCEQRVGLRAEE
jgi:hypothetical protein